MPAPKPISQKNWTKGTITVMDRFSAPKGSVLKASNLLLTERGSLQTCDGTLLQSYLPAAPTPAGIVELGLFVSDTFGLTLLAGIPATQTTLRMYSWLGTGDILNPLTFTGGSSSPADLALTSGWTEPQFIPFAGQTVITLGNGVTPYYSPDGATFTQLSGSNVNTTGAWQANHFYSIGDRVAADSNAYQVTALTVQSTGSAGASGAINNQGGFSGNSTPAFASIDTAGTTVNDNQLIWMCIKANSASLAKQSVPAGAAHAINHAGSFWLWNTAPTNTDPASNNGGADGPSVIRQSSPNDLFGWPNQNIAFVGKDDGTQGTGIATFTIAEAGIAPTGSLVLFKDFSTYQVLGVFSSSDFAIVEVKTDMGCVCSRSVQFATGFGIIRFSHLGFALFDGVNDRLISEEIRPYIFGRSDIVGVDFANLQYGRASLTSNPPMYFCTLPTLDGKRTRLFCYDLVMKAWMVVDYFNGTATQPITTVKQLRPPFQAGLPQGAHTYIADIANGTATIRQWQQGDLSWDGLPIAWSVTPPEVGDPGSRAYFRRCQVRLHASLPGKMTALISLSSTAQPNNAQTSAGAGPSSGAPPNIEKVAMYAGDSDLGVAFDIAQTAPSASATFSGSGRVSIEGIDYHIQPKPPRPFSQAA